MKREAENYIVLLLGVKDDPVPSLWHLQKEMFMISRAVPKVKDFFDFEKHYNGPYSATIQEIVQEPLYYDDAWEIRHRNSVRLTKSGKSLFKKIIATYQDNKKFSDLLKTIKLTREIYDKLTKDELLFLIYQTYPEYIGGSNIYDELVLDEEKRIRLAGSLRTKGLITDKRYNELKGIEQ